MVILNLKLIFNIIIKNGNSISHCSTDMTKQFNTNYKLQLYIQIYYSQPSLASIQFETTFNSHVEQNNCDVLIIV